MHSHGAAASDELLDAIRAAIESKIESSTAEVKGAGGHYEITVTSPVFANQGTLDRQRTVYAAIAHLMDGDSAPIHAIDVLRTKTP